MTSTGPHDTYHTVSENPARLAGGAILLALGLAAAGPPAVAQPPPLRIGVLALGPRKVPAWQCGPRGPRPGASPARADGRDPGILGLRDELESLGYVEEHPRNQGKPGRRFVLDIRENNLEGVRRSAQQFAHERVDLIFAITTTPARAAQEATRTSPIPIVFTAVSDPVEEGFA